MHLESKIKEKASLEFLKDYLKENKSINFIRFYTDNNNNRKFFKFTINNAYFGWKEDMKLYMFTFNDTERLFYRPTMRVVTFDFLEAFFDECYIYDNPDALF